VWEEVPSLLERLVHDTASPLGAKVTFHYQRGIPPVVNDPHVIRRLEHAIVASLGDETLADTFVSMGAEDFARYLDDAPGALLRLGCRDGSSRVDLHSTSFRLDERCLEVGVKAAVAGLFALLED
jgi:amidohydrolase